MPKRHWLIDKYHLGINDVADPRNLRPGELADAVDVMIDEPGIIKTMGSLVVHSAQGATNQPSPQISAGFGLLAFKSDRLYAEGRQALNNGDFETGPGTNWTAADNASFATSGGNSYAKWLINISTMIGTITQTAANRDHSGYNSTSYRFECEITFTTVPDGSGKTLQIASGFPNVATTILSDSDFTNLSDGDVVRVAVEFTSAAAASTADFVLEYKDDDNSSQGEIHVDNLVLTPISPETGDSYLAIFDATGNGDLHVYSDARAEFGVNPIVSIGSVSGAKAVLTYHDDALRIADAGFDADTKPKWYGYINRTDFEGVGNNETPQKLWSEEDNDLAPPTEMAVNSGTYPSLGGVNISIFSSVLTNGTWDTSSTYQFALSFVYDGKQESLLYIPTANNTYTPTETRLGIRFIMSSGYDRRVSGARVYYRVDNSNDSWKFFAEVDFQRGGRTHLDSDFGGNWQNTAIGKLYCGYVYSDDPQIDTYESINGYSPDEVSIDIGQTGDGYKTAVIIGSTMYVGNVKRTGKDGSQVVEPDAIYRSIPGRIDTFPLSNKVVAASGDGEEIVKFESYAGRLLEFKESKMRILNVEGLSEYLEGEYSNLGITNPSASTKTENGIVWVNEYGLFLFDGKGVVNLLERDGIRFISESTWRTFVTSDSTVCYFPQKKYMIIAKDASGGSDGDIYLYSFLTGGIVRGNSKFTDATKYTNAVVDWNGDLVVVENDGVGTINKWSNTPVDSSNISVVTGAIDFDAPGLSKYIYSVLIELKTAALETVTLDYYADDAAAAIFESLSVASSSTWNRKRFEIATVTDSECENIRFKLITVGAAQLTVGKMIIEHRVLRAKRQ